MIDAPCVGGSHGTQALSARLLRLRATMAYYLRIPRNVLASAILLVKLQTHGISGRSPCGYPPYALVLLAILLCEVQVPMGLGKE